MVSVWYNEYMIEIIGVGLVTWFFTRRFYTRTEKQKINKSKLISLRCHHCASVFYTGKQNLRAYPLCMDCVVHV